MNQQPRHRYVVTYAEGSMAEKVSPGTILVDVQKDDGDRWGQWNLHQTGVGITGVAVGYRVGEFVHPLAGGPTAAQAQATAAEISAAARTVAEDGDESAIGLQIAAATAYGFARARTAA